MIPLIPDDEPEEEPAVSAVDKSIDVNKPVRQVYNQWTQFEDFPKFMEGVEEVRQLDDKRLQWRAHIGPSTREWGAEIVEQTPDKVIAWQATGEVTNAGRVTFSELGPEQTRVNLHFEFDPEDMVEKAGDALGVVDRRIQGDLERFKDFIEGRTVETGAWRGEIH